MSTKGIRRFLCIAVVLSSSLLFGCSEDRGRNPHIVFILADDLGYGDVQAYNPGSKIPTPNMNELAESGMKFMDAHASAASCTPTRYGLLTGRYSWRTRLKKRVLWPPAKPLIEKGRATLASVLKKAGYHTAIVGKWHLGLDWALRGDNQINFDLPVSGGPTDLGFDKSYVFAGSADMSPFCFVENGQVIDKPTRRVEAGVFGQSGWKVPGLQPEDIMPLFLERATNLIDDHARSRTGQPLFLYFPLTAPHKPIVPDKPFKGKTGMGDYGDFVYQVDWTVGRIIDKLKARGMYENTLLVVTSDNGATPNMAADAIEKGHDINGPYRGYKATIWEGGHRMPLIVSWPGTIKAGSVTRERVSLNDFIATFAELTGQTMDARYAEDSYSMLPVLLDQPYEQPLREATVVRSGGGCLGIIKDSLKLANCPGSGSGWAGSPTSGEARKMDLPPYQLYNLQTDTAEQHNLQARYPEKEQQLQDILTGYINEGRSTPGPAQQNWQNKNRWEQITWQE